MYFIRLFIKGCRDALNHNKSLANNLRKPQKTVYGQLAMKQMRSKNRYLEENAAKLSNIEPDHRVLEVGIGPGLGIEAAYNYIKDGRGKVYGVDHSLYAIQMAEQLFAREVAKGRIELFETTVTHLPYKNNHFDRIFHVNTYYYWENMHASLKELYRVIKPGGKMVTTLCLKDLKSQKSKNMINRIDPLEYMISVEQAGFKDVRIEYLSHQSITYQVIYSEAGTKI